MEYTWSKYKHEIFNNGKFDSIEECIAEAKDLGIPAGSTIYVGECEDVEIDGIDLSGVLECVEDDMFEQVGEISEDWNVSRIRGREEIYEAYEERLRKLVCDYIKEIGEEPSFCKVVDIRPILVK